MANITQADLDKAQDVFEKASKSTREEKKAEFADLRRRWREQEIEAGRRPPGPEAA